MVFLLRLQVGAKKNPTNTQQQLLTLQKVCFSLLFLFKTSLVGNSVQWRLGFTKASMRSEWVTKQVTSCPITMNSIISYCSYRERSMKFHVCNISDHTSHKYQQAKTGGLNPGCTMKSPESPTPDLLNQKPWRQGQALAAFKILPKLFCILMHEELQRQNF